MIGFLRGTLISKHSPNLLLDVQGVGYEIEATMSTFDDLPATGTECSLFTHLTIRDDAHLLYGFANEVERTLFRDLIKISGVGAKLALTILSGTSVDEFARCIRDNDSAALTRLPGVGKKTAQRLIIEMRDRLEKRGLTGVSLESVLGAEITPETDAISEAVSALIGLGYRPQEASQMVRELDTQDKNSEQIIRDALKSVVR